MSIKAIRCQYEGINFRSKLEAHWYGCFQRIGFFAIYEPDCVFLESQCNDSDGWKYIPDFHITQDHCPNGKMHKYFVEVKPLLDIYPQRDLKSMAKACILGYGSKTLIILGSPFKYIAFIVTDRHKGNPSGFRVKLEKDGLHIVCEWHLATSYPDENNLKLDDPRTGLLEIGLYSSIDYLLASEVWNDLQWNPKMEAR